MIQLVQQLKWNDLNVRRVFTHFNNFFWIITHFHLNVFVNKENCQY